MRSRRNFYIQFGILGLIGALALAACLPAGDSPAAPTNPPAPQGVPEQGLANPASVYCQEQGGVLEMRTDPSGGTYGVCIFPDGSECEEWAFFRGECAPGGSPQPGAPGGLPAAPAGFLVNAGEGLGYKLYGLDGQDSAEWLIPSPAFGRSEGLHLAGPAASGGSASLVFLGSQEGVPSLLVSQQGTLSLLAAFPQPQQFGGMVGLPGSPQLAYTVFEPAEGGAVLRSKLYVGEPGSLPGAAPVLTIDSRQSTYIQPVALRAAEGSVEGVYYTYTMLGIGGGPLVDPRLGLYYLDLANGESLEILGQDRGFSGLSPDQGWTAWTPVQPAPDLELSSQLSGEHVAFPRLPGTAAGPAFATLSPGNVYVAWQEGTDSMSVEPYRGTLRLGTLAGELVADYPDSFFLEKLGLEESSAGIYVRPAAWLDDRVLLVSIFQPEQGRALVTALDALNGGIVFTLDGYFSGLAYP